MIGENSTLALECGVITHLTTKAFSPVDPNLLNPTKSQFIGVDGHFLSVEILALSPNKVLNWSWNCMPPPPPPPPKTALINFDGPVAYYRLLVILMTLYHIRFVTLNRLLVILMTLYHTRLLVILMTLYHTRLHVFDDPVPY